MVQLIDSNFCIDYNDFEFLLDSGGWNLAIGINDKWDVMEHMHYISSLSKPRSNHIVKIQIDCDSLDNATRINIYIKTKNQNFDSNSLPKHIQFIKTKGKDIVIDPRT